MNIPEPEIIKASSRADGAISLFLMVNTFETGGSERQFTVLAKQISRLAFEVHLGCVSRRGPLAEEVGEVAEFPLGGSLYKWQSLTTRLNLNRHLRLHHVEVAHAFDFYANLTLIPAARFARVPLVLGSHRNLGDLLSPAKFRAQLAAFRLCDAITCNSQAGADRLVSAGVPREKLAIIGNAISLAEFDQVAAALPLRPNDAPRVGMVARMNSPFKNHAGFLRIAAQVHHRMPDVEFLLIGDGPLRRELERQTADSKLSDRVRFLGERRDVPAVLSSIDVLVLTSESEGLSNAILEGMAARLPVVAYDVGGLAELVSLDRGFLIKPKSEDDFASAICILLSDVRLRRRLGDNARRFVEGNFGLERIIRRYEDFYTTLLEKKRRKRLAIANF